jgi:hypothetical protein
LASQLLLVAGLLSDEKELCVLRAFAKYGLCRKFMQWATSTSVNCLSRIAETLEHPLLLSNDTLLHSHVARWRLR